MRSERVICMCLLVLTMALIEADAGQGCPFDDGSCQEYCSQQGCNMGYCGHFAWIQCICRKCGDEWSWYDKVRYNPDKTVNQTELDSLKLNGSTPLILTSSSDNNKTQLQQSQPKQQQAATLTTLLIPDLSDTSGKLDLNDIPDENSDKFLDYLAKNHEKLVQATAQARQPSKQSSEDSDDDDEADELPANHTTTSDETVETLEIQISSNDTTTNNNTMHTRQHLADPHTDSAESASPVTRVLKMAVIVERAAE